jgi:hypothetical protein
MGWSLSKKWMVTGMETFTPRFSADKSLSEQAGALFPHVEEACVFELLREGAGLGLTTSATFTSHPFSRTPRVKDAVIHHEKRRPTKMGARIR